MAYTGGHGIRKSVRQNNIRFPKSSFSPWLKNCYLSLTGFWPLNALLEEILGSECVFLNIRQEY